MFPSVVIYPLGEEHPERSSARRNRQPINALVSVCLHLCPKIVGQASPVVDHVGQPFQAVVLTGWKAGPTGAALFTPERSRQRTGHRGTANRVRDTVYSGFLTKFSEAELMQ